MPPRARAVSSPDPLEAPLEMLEESAIASPALAPSSSRKDRLTPNAQSTPRTSTPRAGGSSRRNKVVAVGNDDGAAELVELSRSPNSFKRSQVEPMSRRKGKARALSPEPTSLPSPKRPRPSATPTPLRSTRKTLGSAIKPLPTPPSARKSAAESMRHFDEAFQDPFAVSASVEGISREVFLANESLKRQREARNFKYVGDVDAPKLTRSGRVVGGHPAEAGMGDVNGAEEYGEDGKGGEGEGGEDIEIAEMNDHRGAASGIIDHDEATDVDPIPNGINGTYPAQPLMPDTVPTPKPLLPEARQHILRILSTLTGRQPDMLVNEETNEALHGLANLLKGTVERGEGNSALLVGPRGSGKTATIARTLQLLHSSPSTNPIIVRLSGHAQTTDRLAIREMGRQIAEAEGLKSEIGDEDEDGGGGEEYGHEEYAPTTLPSHLLALLTAPSARAIIIVMEEFDLFTEHARQALLYCLLDVVQSVKPGPVDSTGRGVAVIGLTSRIDTLLLLEKRVKSRFSHRVWRTISPISPGAPGWRVLLKSVLLPEDPTATSGVGDIDERAEESPSNGKRGAKVKRPDTGLERWLKDWRYAVEFILDHEQVGESLDRLTSLTTDIRNLYRPFIYPLSLVASSQTPLPSLPSLLASISAQLSLPGWGPTHSKLKGLAQPPLAILVISKHLAYAGREEFNFQQVEEEYLRFGRTKLVGSGRVRWPVAVLRVAFDQLLHLGLLVPTGQSNLKLQFAKVRCTLSPYEIVAFCKGEGANLLSTELANWGRMMGGHA